MLAEHGIRPSKALGQNFVADHNTVERIARLAGLSPELTIVEVGAGLGGLTQVLAASGAQVVALEIDHRLVEALGELLVGGNVEIVEADALRVDWERLLVNRRRPIVLVSNLPYSVATPLLLRVLEQAPSIERLLVMVQREVGERWVAAPGDPQYGAVSVKVAYWCQASLVGRVPPNVFVPRPKVDSVLASMVRRPQPAVDPSIVSYERFEAVVRAGFAHRRKMLRRSLAAIVEPSAFEAAGVDSSARAEELGVEAWGELARIRP